MERPSDREYRAKMHQMLAIIVDFYKKNYYSPSIRELSDEMGYAPTSTASVMTMLRHMEDEGWITRQPSVARTIVPVGVTIHTKRK